MFYQFHSNLTQSFVIYIRPCIQTHTLIYIHYLIIFRSDINLKSPLFHHPFGHIGTVYQNFAPIRSFSFQYYSVDVVVF